MELPKQFIRSLRSGAPVGFFMVVTGHIESSPHFGGQKSQETMNYPYPKPLTP